MSDCITGRAPKLKKSLGHIDYVISMDDDGLYLQITRNLKSDGEEEKGKSGTFTRKRIHLLGLFERIVTISKVEGSFAPRHLGHVIPGSNNNDQGFVVAILMDIRFVEPVDDRRFRLRRKA